VGESQDAANKQAQYPKRSGDCPPRRAHERSQVGDDSALQGRIAPLARPEAMIHARMQRSDNDDSGGSCLRLAHEALPR
jgi:hypothetical protein